MGVLDGIKNLGYIIKNYSQVSKFYTETTSRPSIMQPYMATDTGAKLPIFPYPLIMIYELADNIDALRIPIEAINREMFKNGFEVIEKFQYLCTNCGKEFMYKPLKGEDADSDEPKGSDGKPKPNGGMDAKPQKPVEKAFDKGGQTNQKQEEEEDLECDQCGSDKLIRPKPENRKKLLKLVNEPVNNNDQTIEDVMRMVERDLEIADGGYLLLLKNYSISESTGEINEKGTEIKEILRIDPPQVAIIADSDGRIGYDDKRNPVWVCPRFEHRSARLTSGICNSTEGGKVCRGTKALKAVMEVSSVYSIGLPQPKRVIYGEGEVIWKPGKYKPGLIYGYSPIFAIWSKAMALSHMDEYIRKYFDKMRPPRGLLVVASRNYETFQKAWDKLEEKATEDPYMVHPLMVESDKGGRNMAQWLDFTGSLKELEFMEMRKELRMIIMAEYGLQQIFVGEHNTGQTSQGYELTVSNRTIEWGQRELKRTFLDRLSKAIGVDDWDLKLKSSEETDDLRDLEIQAQDIQNHSQLQQMGFEVERTHTGKWKVSKKPTFSQMPDPGQGRGPGAFGDKDKVSDFEGQPAKKRPSFAGGVAQGHPASGGKKQGGINPSAKALELPTRGHTKDYWMKRLTKVEGYDDEQAGIIIDGWTEYKGLFYPVDKALPTTKPAKTKYYIKDSDDGYEVEFDDGEEHEEDKKE